MVWASPVGSTSAPAELARCRCCGSARRGECASSGARLLPVWSRRPLSPLPSMRRSAPTASRTARGRAIVSFSARASQRYGAWLAPQNSDGQIAFVVLFEARQLTPTQRTDLRSWGSAWPAGDRLSMNVESGGRGALSTRAWPKRVGLDLGAPPPTTRSAESFIALYATCPTTRAH